MSLKRPLNRVVITGRGVVSPFGQGVPTLMAGIRDGRSSVKRMNGWESVIGLRSFVAAPAELTDEKKIPRQKRRSMSPMSIFAAQASEEALAEAGLAPEALEPGRAGCIIGSTIGSTLSINEFYEHYLPEHKLEDVPSTGFFKAMSHTAAMNIAQYFGLTGHVLATSAACASSLQAIGIGYRLLQLGVQDVLLCGGAEEIHPTVTGTFDLLYAASIGYNDSPERTPRPFDNARDGLVCGEGAGILLLETLEHAEARGANILAEMIGFDTAGSGEHISQSNPEAMARCMKQAIAEAGLSPDKIDYVNAHATGTIQGDKEEAAAIASVFGDTVPASSLKGHFGHTLGAAGAVELAATLGMMQEGVIYPTHNLEHVAPDCEGIAHVLKPERKTLRHVVKNGFAFGGVNAVLVIRAIG